MKTYSVKSGDIKRETHVIDVSDKILGRVATEIAVLLMGKHKAMFCRNADVGDCVTVINAEKIQVTGNKPKQKLYFRHSNYPGGFKNISLEKLMANHPDRVISNAVSGMLPHNHLHAKMMKRLRVFAGLTQSVSNVEKLETAKTGRKKAEIRYIPIETKGSGKKAIKH
jgi:large subunit ribosomal protein L13